MPAAMTARTRWILERRCGWPIGGCRARTGRSWSARWVVGLALSPSVPSASAPAGCSQLRSRPPLRINWTEPTPSSILPSPTAQRSLAALEGLWGGGYFSMPQHYRLGFREFGTTLGVQARGPADGTCVWGRIAASGLETSLAASARKNTGGDSGDATAAWRAACGSVLQVNALAGEEWQGRVERLHQYWAWHLFGRDAGTRLCSSCCCFCAAAVAASR